MPTSLRLSRADVLPAARRELLRRQVERYAPGCAWLELAHAPQGLIRSDGAEQPLADLDGRRVAAFCGVGNPAGFRHTLTACRYELAGFREFPDHHAYTSEDVAALTSWAEGLGVEALLCTRKDLVKLTLARMGSRPLWALGIALEIVAGRDVLEARLHRLLPKQA